MTLLVQVMQVQVRQQSPSQLTLRLLPVMVWLLGIIFLVGGVFAIFAVKVTTLTCQRTHLTRGSCRLFTSSLLESKVREIPVNTLQGAKDEDDGIVLLTTSGEVSLDSASDSNSSSDTSRINEFVSTPQQRTLTIQVDGRFFFYLIGGFFIASASFVLLSYSQIVTCVFDRTLGTFTLKQQGLFGTKITEYQIGEIVDIRVEELKDSDGSTYGLGIILRSGERLPLTRYYSSGKRHSYQEIADRLRQFLKLNNQNSG